MRSSARRVLASVLLLLVAVALSGQSTDRPVVPGAEPYEKDEFPVWARDLRRAEIVALGSFPLALLATRLVYGFGRFFAASIAAGAIDPAYLPPLFAPPGAVPLDRQDNARILTGAVSLSAVIAVVDFALGRRETPDE